MNAVFNPSAEKWDVLELLALLNGKGVKYEMGRGGLPKVTGLDVAGALAGLPDHIQRYAYLLAGAALRPADTKRVGNANGWTVLRFTTGQIKSGAAIEMVRMALE